MAHQSGAKSSAPPRTSSPRRRSSHIPGAADAEHPAQGASGPAAVLLPADIPLRLQAAINSVTSFTKPELKKVGSLVAWLLLCGHVLLQLAVWPCAFATCCVALTLCPRLGVSADAKTSHQVLRTHSLPLCAPTATCLSVHPLILLRRWPTSTAGRAVGRRSCSV